MLHETHLNNSFCDGTQLCRSEIPIWSLNQSEIEYLFALRFEPWISNQLVVIASWINNKLRRVCSQPLGSAATYQAHEKHDDVGDYQDDLWYGGRDVVVEELLVLFFGEVAVLDVADARHVVIDSTVGVRGRTCRYAGIW